GLVRCEELGTRNVYRLDPAGLSELRAWLDGFWDVALERYAERVRADSASAADSASTAVGLALAGRRAATEILLSRRGGLIFGSDPDGGQPDPALRSAHAARCGVVLERPRHHPSTGRAGSRGGRLRLLLRARAHPHPGPARLAAPADRDGRVARRTVPANAGPVGGAEHGRRG